MSTDFQRTTPSYTTPKQNYSVSFLLNIKPVQYEEMWLCYGNIFLCGEEIARSLHFIVFSTDRPIKEYSPAAGQELVGGKGVLPKSTVLT